MVVEQIEEKELSNKIEMNTLIIVDFFASWCGPCRQLAPIMEELSEASDDRYEIYKVDIDVEANKDFVLKHMIMSIPAVLFFKEGKLVDNFVGVKDKKEIQELIDKHA